MSLPSFFSATGHTTLSMLTLMTGGMPIFFHRCGLTHELFDLIIEIRPSSTSGGIVEQIKRELRLHCKVCTTVTYRVQNSTCWSIIDADLSTLPSLSQRQRSPEPWPRTLVWTKGLSRAFLLLMIRSDMVVGQFLWRWLQKYFSTSYHSQGKASLSFTLGP